MPASRMQQVIHRKLKRAVVANAILREEDLEPAPAA
jgi:hypothetical protein